MEKRAILEHILNKGELQVSEKEREAALETLLKEIASIVAVKTFNPTTNLPYTVNLIQNAMKEINFSATVSKSSKAQALFVIKKLKDVMPIARTNMLVRVTFATRDFDAIRGAS